MVKFNYNNFKPENYEAKRQWLEKEGSNDTQKCNFINSILGLRWVN